MSPSSPSLLGIEEEAGQAPPGMAITCPHVLFFSQRYAWRLSCHCLIGSSTALPSFLQMLDWLVLLETWEGPKRVFPRQVAQCLPCPSSHILGSLLLPHNVWRKSQAEKCPPRPPCLLPLPTRPSLFSSSLPVPSPGSCNPVSEYNKYCFNKPWREEHV